MTERSYLWSTGGAGDGSATYTRQDWQRISQVASAVHGSEGIAPSLLNLLGISFTTNTATINTGAALVDGKPYYNDASVNITVPSAVGGGNTRIDRIVLRADWTAQTIRLTRIAGTDAASPTAPAVTTSSGSTYDVLLYQVRVNTSGTVTQEADERAWARVQTAGIALDAVDDTIAGNRVPQFYRRQGGDANNWNTHGTTTYTPGAVRMQAGAVSVSNVSANSFATVTVTFPVAFSQVPMVLCSLRHQSDLTYWAGPNQAATVHVYSVSATQVLMVVLNHSGSTLSLPAINWLAIGAE